MVVHRALSQQILISDFFFQKFIAVALIVFASLILLASAVPINENAQFQQVQPLDAGNLLRFRL